MRHSRFGAWLEHQVDARSVRFGVWLYRRTDGRAPHLWHRRALVLTTTGRRSGRSRTVLVQFFPDGEDLVVVAANSGLPTNPGWYFNLTAHPHAHVEVEGRQLDVRAVELAPEDAAAFWPRVLEVAPDYAKYTRRTSRPIPLLRLVPLVRQPDECATDSPTTPRAPLPRLGAEGGARVAVAPRLAAVSPTSRRLGPGRPSLATALADQLAVPADPGGFTEADVSGLDEPVRRYLTAAIAPGTPLARAARLRITGAIRFGGRWVPFRAEELLAPLHGYLWPASVAGGLLRGSDTYADGEARMTWRLLGLVPVIRAGGPDVARSAAGRAAAEAVWVPTALLPRYGVRWHAESSGHLVADLPVVGRRVTVHLGIDADARVRSVHLDRWTDPDGTGTFGWHPFGIDATATHTFRSGVTVPAQGIGGWFHGTDRWPEGQFMRYTIHDLTLLGDRP